MLIREPEAARPLPGEAVSPPGTNGPGFLAVRCRPKLRYCAALKRPGRDVYGSRRNSVVRGELGDREPWALQHSTLVEHVLWQAIRRDIRREESVGRTVGLFPQRSQRRPVRPPTGPQPLSVPSD